LISINKINRDTVLDNFKSLENY